MDGRSIRWALHLAPGARLLVLSEDAATPAALAAWLNARGWGPSRIAVLSRMGGPGESRLDGVAESWRAAAGDDLNTIAVECVAGPRARALSTAPGLPDDAFAHDARSPSARSARPRSPRTARCRVSALGRGRGERVGRDRVVCARRAAARAGCGRARRGDAPIWLRATPRRSACRSSR
jgi:hypothetical protein